MTRLGLATAVVACLPNGVMEQILEIWESKGDYQVVMEFRHGRCLRIKVTESRQFQGEDFAESVDNVTPPI